VLPERRRSFVIPRRPASGAWSAEPRHIPVNHAQHILL
jgi:hypothetical protein